MQTVTIQQITDNLRKLPTSKLAVVYDFVAYLTEKEIGQAPHTTAQAAVTLLSTAEYEQLLRYKRLAVFNEFTRQFGQAVETRGLSEEELIADLEETKREVFAEQYGRP
jgi:hypothetical protein